MIDSPKYFQLDYNVNLIYQVTWNACKKLHRGKFIFLMECIKSLGPLIKAGQELAY